MGYWTGNAESGGVWVEDEFIARPADTSQLTDLSTAGNSGYDAFQYVDPATGATYRRAYTGGGVSEQGTVDATLAGYVATDGRDWYEGQRGTVFDLSGKATSSFAVEDPNKRDIGEMLALGLIAAVTGGAALTAAGVIGGGAAAAGGGSGAWLGEGVASGVGAWDAAAVNAGLSLPGAGTLVNPFLGEGVASGVPAWDGAAAAAGVPISPGGMIIENVGDLAGDAAAASPPRTSLPGSGGSGAWLGEGVPSGVPAWDGAAIKAGVPLTNVPLPPLPSSPLPSLPGSITLDTSGLTSALAGITQTVAGIPGLINSLLPKPAAPVVAGSSSAGPLGLPWLAWGGLGIAAAYLISRKA